MSQSPTVSLRIASSGVGVALVELVGEPGRSYLTEQLAKA